MPYPFLSNAQLLDEGTLQELDTLVTRLRAFLQVSHQADGTLIGNGASGGVAGPHHLTHEAGGADLVVVTEPMLNFSDVLVADVTTARHGLTPKLPGGTTTFLRGDGTYAAVTAVGPPQPHRLTHEPGGSDPLTIDAAPTVGSLRTLGSGPQQAAPGNAARTPLAHHATHEPGGSDPMAVDAAVTVGSLRTLGTGANQAAPGNDTRLTGPRVPTAHATTHASAGSDPVTVTGLAGYPGGTANFLRADGAFAAPPGIAALEYRGAYAAGTYNDGDIVIASDGIAYLCTKAGVTTPPEPWAIVGVPPAHHATHEAGGVDAVVVSEPMIALTDLTTMNVTTGRHGFAPKLPNDANRFFDGSGAYNPLNWTDVPYSAANFFASGSMVFTVTAGQVGAFAYTLHGRTALVTIAINGGTVSGTPDTYLYIRLPVTATKAVRVPVIYLHATASWVAGLADVPIGANYVGCVTTGGAAWPVGGVYLGIQLIIPI